MRQVIFCICIGMVCLSFPALAESVDAIKIVSHKLELTLDPATHSLSGKDRLTLALGTDTVREFSFLLHKELSIHSALINNQAVRVTKKSDPQDATVNRFTTVLPAIPAQQNQIELLITYSGKVYDQVKQAKDLAFVIGDETRGIIAPEGVYLYKGSFYYPDMEVSLASFDVTITTPETIRAVTQGNLVQDRVQKGKRIRQFTSSIPVDGLSLVANTFEVNSIENDGVTISTYLFSEDAQFSPMLLEATSGFLSLYTKYLGEFPYNRFDIVENFFTTGYGMPGFTLLGKEVIKQGAFILRPGHIDHELVHSWWGNYVYPPPDGENWSEGITTYLTNYLRNELTGEKEAISFRNRILQKYAIMVKPENEYPVRQFLTKKEEEDNEIGYDKSAMIFHMLRRKVGNDTFFKSLRRVIASRGGKYATWDDFRIAFEVESAIDLKSWFSQWLDRKGGPRFSLDDLSAKLEGTDFTVSATLIQDEPVYEMDVPICFRFQTGDMIQDVKVTGPITPLRYRFKTFPYEVCIDPSANVFRLLTRQEIIPCLNRTIEDNPLVITPGNPLPGHAPLYSLVVERLKANGAAIISDSEATPDKMKASSLIILGLPQENVAISLIQEQLKAEFLAFSQQGVLLNKKEHSGDDISFVVSTDNPLNPEKSLSLYAGYSETALERARLLFFYGWDSFVVFKAGRVIERGDFSKQDPRNVQPLQTLLPTDKISPKVQTSLKQITEQDIRERIETLSKKDFEGRLAGSAGEAKARKYIKKQLHKLKIEPLSETYDQHFEIALQDIVSYSFKASIKNVSLDPQTLADQVVPLPGFDASDWMDMELIYFPHGLPPDRKADIYKHLTGKILIFPVPFGSDPDAEFIYKEQLDRASEALAGGIIIISGKEIADSPWCAFPGFMTESVNKSLQRSESYAPFSSKDMFISGIQSRVPKPKSGAALTVLVASEQFLKTILQSSGIEQSRLEKDVSINLPDVQVSLQLTGKTSWRAAANVVGVIRGSMAPDEAEWVILGAHLDHLGRGSDGIYPGADDNASGVAALLAISEQLKAQQHDLKRNVMIAFFSGEEWGLRGAYHLAANLPVDTKRVIAMINLDTIGRNEPDSVHIIGALRSNDLTALFRKNSAVAGLQVTSGLEFAFKYGSDHYPFYQLGIPSIDLCSSLHKDYHKITDTADKINNDKVARIARLTFLAVMELTANPIQLDPPRSVNVPYPTRKSK